MGCGTSIMHTGPESEDVANDVDRHFHHRLIKNLPNFMRGGNRAEYPISDNNNNNNNSMHGGVSFSLQNNPYDGKTSNNNNNNNNNNNEEEDEESLSDIDITLSTRNSVCDAYNNPILGASHALFRAEDLEKQRNEAPLSIAEDLFVYDDAIISKNEAQTKHWRIEGRKPPAATRRLSGNPDSSRKLFHFTDFNVCVDEMDVTVSSEMESGSETLRLTIQKQQQQQQQHEGKEQPTLRGATVTRTFSTIPNTVAAMELAKKKKEEEQQQQQHNSQPRVRPSQQREEYQKDKQTPIQYRPLRDFDVKTLIGHSARVKCISITPNERSFVSCSSEEASVTMRSLSTGEEEGIFTGHRDTVICTALSPDGKYLATASKDHTMTLWDATITKLLYVLQHDKVVICCCFSPDSKTVVSGCQDRVCRLWDTRRAMEKLAYNQHAGIIVSVAYSPDGSQVCSTSADKTLRVWSATTGRTHLTLQGHIGIVLSCSYSNDGKYIISNDESHLCVWSATDGVCKLKLAVSDFANKLKSTTRVMKFGWTLSCAAPGPFVQYAVVACTNRFVYIIDIHTGEEYASIFCKAPVYCMSRSSGTTLVFGDSFGNVYKQTLL